VASYLCRRADQVYALKNAGGRPRLASVAFDGRYTGLAL
jgi:hypothetical protein